MKFNLFFNTKYLALVFGVLIPLAETFRRWSQLLDVNYFFLWFDDYLLGGFMLLAFWRAIRNPVQGEKFLAAAWGMASGGMFLSFAGQIRDLDKDDPAPVASSIVAWIKGILSIIFILCLVSVLCQTKSEENPDTRRQK